MDTNSVEATLLFPFASVTTVALMPRSSPLDSRVFSPLTRSDLAISSVTWILRHPRVSTRVAFSDV
jgi:hypothetical protein